MTPRRPNVRLALPVVAFAVAMVAAACGGSAASPSPSPSASTAACPTTPEPASDAVSAWSGDQSPSVYPQMIDPGVLACGDNRMMFSFLDITTNAPVAAPDRSVSVALYDLGADAETPAVTADATFIWAIEDEVGVYVADVAFPTAGLWGAEFTTAIADAAPETIRLSFPVRTERTVISIGEPAPPSDTPTLADVDGDLARISTDDEPVEAFYEASIADAVTASEPFVVVFATPKFCASTQCGPTLDRVKPIAAAHPDVTFINVEPYQLEDVDGQLQPVLTGDPPALTPAASTEEWGLPTEPWIFVVDRDGIVTGSFMLIASDEELEAAVSAVE